MKKPVLIAAIDPMRKTDDRFLDGIKGGDTNCRGPSRSWATARRRSGRCGPGGVVAKRLGDPPRTKWWKILNRDYS